MSGTSSMHRFLLRLPRMGREISDTNWQEIEPEAVKQIRSLQTLINSELIDFERRRYKLTFDLEPAALHFQNY